MVVVVVVAPAVVHTYRTVKSRDSAVQCSLQERDRAPHVATRSWRSIRSLSPEAAFKQVQVDIAGLLNVETVSAGWFRVQL